jgi:hypothetical protein
MSDKNKAAQEAIEGALQRRAIEVVAAPIGQREKLYATYRRNYRHSVTENGGSEAKADEFAAKMDEWIRALVQIIETSGSPSKTAQ